MNLYQLDKEIKNLLEVDFLEDDTIINKATGEVFTMEEFETKMNALAISIDTKLENIVAYIKTLQANAKMFEEEKQKLEKKHKTISNLANNLTKYLDSYIKLIHTNKETQVLDEKKLLAYKFETPKALIKYRKSTKVEINDEKAIEDKYVNAEITRKIDKKAIAADLKADVEVKGASLITSQNINIS